MYGSPQHEENINSDWERGYYGEAEHETPSRPVEFVSGIEYRSDTTAEGAGTSGENGRVRPLSASD
ncbi:hypothetical protein [Halalkalicoccus jeotgali]|uniref:Uncharacterized protein n=1 Tax=Halalkalicoccus jeotgali (strain DSM 18796 / CECT 7217 / JCM 14584 / KCTC 4019 / B3) TaxID=795797 RepID=D8J4I8_HALJB|nr:hypothetical protein [Halalkalicoccus jeotgali]ADJ13550.1 hypothetical protein HacjB3_00785 [Halalkalicoccus jeotgali B3]ELY32975.1 hypothetical protein C497_18547 [Halalkalicoccus jeotgali B3]